MSWLQALAARGPVPVYPAVGSGAADEAQRLALAPDIELVATPRHASVLLVAGDIRASDQGALRRVHAQLPRPCATLWYRSRPFSELAQPHVLDDWKALPRALIRLHRMLLRSPRDREPTLLPDEPPAPFEGRGDHGQGGEGMMGGTPHGRAMAMTADDLQDGLALDVLAFTLGPFYRGLSPGLVLELSLQGDLVQQCTVQARPYPQPLAAPFVEALDHPVPIADLELARARHHLRRLAHALELVGLSALGLRLLRAAAGLSPGRALPWLRPMLQGSGLLRSTGPASGILSADQAAEAGGPAARAAGVALDARSEDQAYTQLGFEPTLQTGGDSRARCRQWLDEIDQALVLASRAAAIGARTTAVGLVESPAGRLTHDQPLPDISPMLESVLPGCEWSEALAVIASLPLAGRTASGMEAA